jgi:hypothetical protein
MEPDQQALPPFVELGWAPVEDMAPKLHRDPIVVGLEVESEVPNETYKVQPSEMELQVASPAIAYSSHLLAWAVWILFFLMADSGNRPFLTCIWP